MADISQLLELLKQRAFLQEGGGQPDRIAQVGQALNNLGTGIQKGVGAYQDARDRNLIAAKAIFELEHAKSDAQPFGHDLGVPTQREDDAMKQIFSNKQSTNVAPNVFPQPTPELENAPPPPAPVQAPFIDPRQARIKELTAQGLNIPPALYDIPRKDIKDVAGANLGFSNANLRNAMAGQLGKTIWFNPSTLDVQPAIPGQIPPTGYSEWGLNNALKESSKGGLETKKANERMPLLDAQGHIVTDDNGNPIMIPKGTKVLPRPNVKSGDRHVSEVYPPGVPRPPEYTPDLDRMTMAEAKNIINIRAADSAKGAGRQNQQDMRNKNRGVIQRVANWLDGVPNDALTPNGNQGQSGNGSSLQNLIDKHKNQ